MIISHTGEQTKQIIFIVNEDTLPMSLYTGLLNEQRYSIGVFESVSDANSCLKGEFAFHLLIIDATLAAADTVQFMARLNALNIPVLYIGANAEEFVGIGKLAVLNELLIQPVSASTLIVSIAFNLAFAERLNSLVSNIHQLECQLTADCIIGVAIGITMQRHKMSKVDAMDALIKQAKFQRSLLEDLSMTILESAELSFSSTRGR